MIIYVGLPVVQWTASAVMRARMRSASGPCQWQTGSAKWHTRRAPGAGQRSRLTGHCHWSMLRRCCGPAAVERADGDAVADRARSPVVVVVQFLSFRVQCSDR